MTAVYEGWFKNPDGSFSLLFGYFNRNLKEELDIPVGANNRIEPGGPDQGQPTHFLPRRQWGLFTVTVPKNFGTDKLTWTLVANGQTTAVPAHLDARWEISPFFDVGIGNTPPLISFEEGGPSVQGPRGISIALETTLRNPVTLNLWAADDAKTFQGGKAPDTPPVTVTWSKFRGPGAVKFANSKPAGRKSRRQVEDHSCLQRQGDDDRYVQRARRVRVARGSQRLVRGRRRRIPVLLDEWSGEGLRQAGSDGRPIIRYESIDSSGWSILQSIKATRFNSLASA